MSAAWAPYCLVCSTMGRMTRTSTGWKCEGKGDHFGRVGCGNEIGFDLRKLNSQPGVRTLESSPDQKSAGPTPLRVGSDQQPPSAPAAGASISGGAE